MIGADGQPAARRRGRPCGTMQGYVSHSPDKLLFLRQEKLFMTNGNGVPPEAGAPPQLNVLAQYTKDLSFENPNAPASLAPQSQPPQINIQINVGANNLAESEYEVT